MTSKVSFIEKIAKKLKNCFPGGRLVIEDEFTKEEVELYCKLVRSKNLIHTSLSTALTMGLSDILIPAGFMTNRATECFLAIFYNGNRIPTVNVKVLHRNGGFEHCTKYLYPGEPIEYVWNYTEPKIKSGMIIVEFTGFARKKSGEKLLNLYLKAVISKAKKNSNL